MKTHQQVKIAKAVEKQTKMKLLKAIDTAMLKMFNLEFRLSRTFSGAFYDAHLDEIGETAWGLANTWFSVLTGESSINSFSDRFTAPGDGRPKLPVAWWDGNNKYQYRGFMPDTIADVLLNDQLHFSERVKRVSEIYQICRKLESDYNRKKTAHVSKSDGYLKAKREVVANIDSRILKLQQKINGWDMGPFSEAITQGQIEALESLRQYIRNNMLWHSKPGRRKND